MELVLLPEVLAEALRVLALQVVLGMEEPLEVAQEAMEVGQVVRGGGLACEVPESEKDQTVGPLLL